MIRKIVFVVFAIATMAVAAHAAGHDNATPVPGGDKSSPSVGPSYFEGVWAGSWPGWRGSSVYQEVTVKIARGKKDGGFIVEYSWGPGPAGSGFPPIPGSFKTKGREEGDQFIFGWTNKEGRNFQVTLKKHEDNKAKARIERSGPTGPQERPYNETYLNRK
jgi:hypothetical protein